METRASYTLVGAFVLVLAGTLIGVAVWLAGAGLNRAATEYLIYFEGDVTGLGVGSPVRYRGVPVGTVRDVRIDRTNVERVRVLIEISDETPIKVDTVAELALQGVTALAYVQLTGGTHAAPPLQPESPDEPAVIASRRSFLQEVITSLPLIIQKGVVVSDRLAHLLSEENIRAISETLESLRRTSDILGSEEGKLVQFLHDSRQVLQTLQSSMREVQDLAGQLNARIDPIADNARTTMQDAKSTLADLRSAATGVEELALRLNAIVADSEGPMREFARSGLYEFSLFLSEARILVDSLTRLTTQIERNPAQFFFGSDDSGVKTQ